MHTPSRPIPCLGIRHSCTRCLRPRSQYEAEWSWPRADSLPSGRLQKGLQTRSGTKEGLLDRGALLSHPRASNYADTWLCHGGEKPAAQQTSHRAVRGPQNAGSYAREKTHAQKPAIIHHQGWQERASPSENGGARGAVCQFQQHQHEPHNWKPTHPPHQRALFAYNDKNEILS